MEFDLPDLREQNPWWRKKESINEEVRIKDYKKSKYKWDPRIKETFKLEKDIIYTLRGPRQVGKTTLTKLLIKKLLVERKVDPQRIFYYTCDIIKTDEDLTDLLNTYLDWIRSQSEGRLYIFLDEISSVRNWQQGIKLLKDSGRLENCTLLLTGSHSIDIKESGEMLPGRRGEEANKNKILTPMKFAEYLEVTESDLLPPRPFVVRKPELFKLFEGDISPIIQETRPHLKELNQKLDSYLKSGGFPKTVNQFHTKNRINHELYELYVNIVLGDIYKWGLKKGYLRDIIERAIETRTTRVGWNTLKKNTSIRHHDTVKNYVEVLKGSYILNILHKVNLNKKTPETSAYKKIYFSDPFIFHSLTSWIYGYNDPFKKSEELLEDPEFKAKMIEEVVADHIIRLAYNLQLSDHFDPEECVFYWSDSKEIDFIFKYNQRLWPIEVKFKEKIKDKGEWISKRFENSINPIIISKEKFQIGENCIILPASIFLYLV